MSKLTPKQERFVHVYLETGNASEAYRQAYNVKEGTKAQSIHSNATRLLADAEVMLRIEELQSQAAAKAVLTREWVLQRLMLNAKMCMGEVPVTLDRVNKDGEKVTVEIRKHDPAGAARSLELLGKELAMFVDRSENKHVVSHEDMLDMLDKVEIATNESQRRTDLN